MNYNLKFTIIKSGKNQILIARQAEIQESRLSKIVNGYVEPTVEEKKRIAKVLECTVEFLFDK
jgi:transcriptional regulator with XRE-family HTH domain